MKTPNTGVKLRTPKRPLIVGSISYSSGLKVVRANKQNKNKADAPEKISK